mgnify:CR=1 FL=1
MKQLLFALSLSALLPSVTTATLVPIVELSFPASFDATGNATVVDQSTAGNDFTTFNANAGYNASLAPSGMPGGSYGGGPGHGIIPTIDLLNNTDVAANGGFTMDTWFLWPGAFSDSRKLIDYAGTELLRTNGSKVEFRISNGSFVLDADIVQDTWYHVIGEFITDGGTSTVGGMDAITGTMNLWLDSGSGLILADTSAGAKSTFGDSLDRGIGINRHPTASEFNQGYLYNPAVYLGVSTVPEPGTMTLVALGSIALLLRRRTA